MQTQSGGIYASLNSLIAKGDAPQSSGASTAKTTSNVVTYDNIDSTVWQQAAAALTPLIIDSQTTNQYLEGLYVRPTDEPAAGDISGTFNQGLNINADAVALGTDTTGDYISSIVAGLGVTASGGGEGGAVTLTAKAGDGISVTGDGIAVTLQSDGGLTLGSGGLTLLDTCSDGQLLKWETSTNSWVCGSDNAGGGSLTVRESDGSPSASPVPLLEFGPASNSSDEFVITDQGGGTARVRTGTAVPLSNASATISGAWTYSSQILANGGLSCADCIALGGETTGNYLAGITAGGGINVSGSGSEGATPAVSLDTTSANNWTGVQTFANGFTLNGNTYTNLTGTGLNFSGGSLSAALGVSIDSSEIINGTIVAADIADATLTLAKLGQNGCATNEIIKWNGTSWACAVDVDTDTNTDAQTLSYVTGTQALSISGGNSVSLTSLLDNTDAQAISRTGNTLSITGNTSTADLSPYLDNTDAQVLSKTGNTLSISGSAPTVDLSPYLDNTDVLAGLSCSSQQIAKWNGTSWACAADVDTDTNTTYSAGTGLSLAGTTFSLDSALAMFKTISTSLGTSPVADSLGDTLTLSSGSGVNVTGDATIDAVSFGLNLATGGGLLTTGNALTLLNTCGDGQYLAWASGTTSWGCATISAAPNEFQTIAGDSGSALADAANDSITLVGGNGLSTTGSDASDTVTFNIDLASGSGLAFSGGSLTIQSCSDGQILRRVAGAWACASDVDAPVASYKQQLAGTDNITVGSSLTPVLTNGSGTPQSLGITITSGSEVLLTATIELSSSLATGPATYVLVRDDNHDNDCVIGGGDGTQVGGQTTSFVASVAQSFTTSVSFVDTSPATTSFYQLCASTTIGLGTATITDRSLILHEINL
ncbi:MAG TPA: hypothetical protein VLI54_00965 [Bacillota bacterium]|nr:hypothetical protein [Bacillota bacterium]